MLCKAQHDTELHSCTENAEIQQKVASVVTLVGLF